MVSDKPDFDGAIWEPFVTTKSVTKGGSVCVRYRDAKGRKEVTASTSGQASERGDRDGGVGSYQHAQPEPRRPHLRARRRTRKRILVSSPKPTFVFQPGKP